jgi:two-component system chemotaxis sensor kinase CheA
VVIAGGSGRAGLIVDELLEEAEIVVKGLGRRVRRARSVSGATLLPSGKLALILAAGELARLAHHAPRAPAPPREAAFTDESRPAAKKRILVVDDSVTTRALERAILVAAGFEVQVAADGVEALRILDGGGDGGPPCDLVVSDVEMPRMDGVALTAAIRRAPRLASLPVILVTALASDADRRRGLEAGASAYLVKSGFDQSVLLDAIGREL